MEIRKLDGSIMVITQTYDENDVEGKQICYIDQASEKYGEFLTLMGRTEEE